MLSQLFDRAHQAIRLQIRWAQAACLPVISQMIRFIELGECVCAAILDPSGRASYTRVDTACRDRGIETPALPQDKLKTRSKRILHDL